MKSSKNPYFFIDFRCSSSMGFSFYAALSESSLTVSFIFLIWSITGLISTVMTIILPFKQRIDFIKKG